MQDLDFDTETRVGRDWTKSLALAAICLGLVVVSAYGVRMEPHGYQEGRFHRGAFVILPVFSLLAPFVLFRLVVPWGAPVRIGPEGFRDLRAGRKTIPWDEISNVVSAGEFVTLTLRRRFTKTYPVSRSQRALKFLRKSAGPNHLVVANWCLATASGEMFEIVTAYRAAHARGGDGTGST